MSGVLVVNRYVGMAGISWPVFRGGGSELMFTMAGSSIVVLYSCMAGSSRLMLVMAHGSNLIFGVTGYSRDWCLGGPQVMFGSALVFYGLVGYVGIVGGSKRDVWGGTLTRNCRFSSRSLCTSSCSRLHSSMIFFTSPSSREALADLGMEDSDFSKEEDNTLLLSPSCWG